MLNINSMLKLVILVSGFICVVSVAILLVSLANSRITELWIIKLPKQSRLIKQVNVELVSKELNHLAAILHVYAGGLIFMK